jgi:hypothetical protein
LSKNIWTWEKTREKIITLRGRLGFPDSSVLKFLRFSLSLEDGSIYDELRDKMAKEVEAGVYCILTGYAEAEPTPETHKLISFEQLPGGRAYYNTFRKRATQQIERVFSAKPQMLFKAGEMFDAIKLEYGDYSVKFYALPLVPINAILWSSGLEFPTSASILFDSSVSNYLSTEQIAALGELAAFRLKQAFEAMTSKE